MLTIEIPGIELYDKITREFTPVPGAVIELEHSLSAISKWEEKWCIPYFTDTEKTKEQTIDYIRCMCETPGVNSDVFNYLTNANVKDISEYIKRPMTATWFTGDESGGSNDEQVTSELVYYWMASFRIPFECDKWNIRRLFTLIKICSEKNKPEKKMAINDVYARNARLNAERCAKLGTTG